MVGRRGPSNGCSITPAVDARWCVVHATHVTADETRRLAASGAIAGLAPTTEADLGDGTFPARAFLDAGGAFGIGSDSNTIVDPYAELRQLEWSQRLAHAVAQRARRRAPSRSAWRSMRGLRAAAGARSAARRVRSRRACAPIWSCSNGDDPALADLPPETLLDAAIFGPCRRPVRDVMVGGRWVVRDGRHPREDAVLAATARRSQG